MDALNGWAAITKSVWKAAKTELGVPLEEQTFNYVEGWVVTTIPAWFLYDKAWVGSGITNPLTMEWNVESYDSAYALKVYSILRDQLDDIYLDDETQASVLYDCLSHFTYVLGSLIQS